MKYISTFIVLFSLLFSFAFAGDDTQTNFDGAKTDIVNIQVPDSGLPSGVSNQKGKVGNILSRLFGNDGKINNFFLKALGNRSDGAVLRWSGGNGGQFVQGSIHDTGTNVGIGTSNPQWKMHVTSDQDNIFVERTQNDTSMRGAIVFSRGDSSGNKMSIRTIGDGSNGVAGLKIGKNNNDLEGFYIDLTERVGIGTTSPTHKLDVAGDINLSGNLYKNGVQLLAGKFIDGTDTNDAVYTTGNVGIGTETPASKLDVDAANATGRIAAFRSTTGNSKEFLGVYGYSDDYSTAYLQDTVMLYAGNASKNLNITAASDQGAIRFLTTGFTTQGHEKMIINAAGNVGIGTSSPQTDLDIAGTTDGFARLNGSDGTLQLKNNDTTNVWKINAAGASGETKLYIQDDGDARLAIDTLGRVGIGTGSPTHPLDLRGNMRVDSTSSSYDLWMQGGAATSGDDRNLAILGYDEDSGDRLVINWAGEYANGTQIGGGNFGVGTASMPSKININGGGDISSAGDQSATLLLTQTNNRLAIDANEMQSSLNGAATSFAINPFGGNVGIGSFPASGLKLDVNGKVGASQYCDGAGNNCTNPSDLRKQSLSCTTRSVTLTRLSDRQAGTVTCPSGYIMTGGGIKTSWWDGEEPAKAYPEGNGFRCDQRPDSQLGTCYVRCCKI